MSFRTVDQCIQTALNRCYESQARAELGCNICIKLDNMNMYYDKNILNINMKLFYYLLVISMSLTQIVEACVLSFILGMAVAYCTSRHPIFDMLKLFESTYIFAPGF